MSTQYIRNFYCDTNQTQKGNGITNNLSTQTQQYQIITPKDYNEMINVLKKVHDFGESDTTTRKPELSNITINVNGIDVLLKKEQFELIEPDFYNNILITLEQARREAKFNIIYGSYFDDLLEKVKNYKIPSTRYYTTTTTCCDCYGDCCDDDCCDSDSSGCADTDYCNCISCDDFHCGFSFV